MTILISGGTGTIGSQLIRYFSKKNKVISIYNKKKPKRISGVKYFSFKKINKEKLLKHDIKMFIHCATKHYNFQGNLVRYNTRIFKKILDV